MIILHAGLCDAQLFLWGEIPPEGDGSAEAQSSAAAAALPYDAAAETLVEALAETGCRLDAERAEPRVAWLPTRDGMPLPSSPLIAEVPA